MKKSVILAALASVAPFAVQAGDQEPKSSYSITLDVPFVSKYVFRGQEVGKSAFQPSVEVGVDNFYVGVWSNQPMKKVEDPEFDYTGGYKLKVNEGWDVDFGATVYHYPQIETGPGVHKSTTEGYVGVNGDIKGITPSVYVYHDFDLKTTTVQGQLGYSVPIAEIGLSAEFSGALGHVYFKETNDDYNYWSLDLNLPYKVTDKATLFAGTTYSNTNIKGSLRDRVAFRFGFTLEY